MKRKRENLMPCSVIASIVGEDAGALDFQSFIARHVPEVPPLDRGRMLPLLLRTVVVPNENFKVMAKVNTKVCQSLSSLVDGVVWSLVQRRERQRRIKVVAASNRGQYNHSNLLSLGYSIPSEQHTLIGAQSSRSMPSGVTMVHLNNNVDYCKTSLLFQTIHQLVGDDFLRELLLNTSIFIPASSGDSNSISKGNSSNFLQLTGQPVKGRQVRESVPTHKRLRKRKRGELGIDVPQHLLPNSIVSRKGVFYSDSFSPSVGLGSNHVLNTVTEPAALLEAMLQGTAMGNKKRVSSLRSRAEKILIDTIKGHMQYQYGRMLDRYCQLPEICRQQPKGTVALDQAAKAFQPSQQVTAFLKSAITNVFPLALWGNANNLTTFLRNVDAFVNLRKQEQLTNQELMKGIKITKVDWIHSSDYRMDRAEHRRSELVFLALMRWIMESFLVPLMRSSFYVTETEFSAKQVLYYRKPAWSMFRCLAMEKLLGAQYTEITKEEAVKRLATQEMGFSKLRLLPKETGVRPIAMLCKHERMDTDPCIPNLQIAGGDTTREQKKLYTPPALSTNTMMSDTFAVLKFEHKNNANLFGAGVHGLHFFYPKYRNFIRSLRKRGAVTRLVFGSVDINKCYDNINQEYLLQVVSGILSREDYLVRRYSIVHPCRGVGRVLKRPQKVAEPPTMLQPFHKSANELSCEHHGSVFIDGVGVSMIRKKEVLSKLQEHLTGNLVLAKGRYGDRYLVQSKGIPQGSVLSSTLCNFYYGNIEQKLLPQYFLNKDGEGAVAEATSLLSRMVDDYLLVTTNESEMRTFIDTMLTGRPELGVSVNSKKTRVSCDIGVGLQDATCCDLAAATNSFSWCGMLFDTRNGEVRIDYSRFYDGQARDGLTVDGISRKGLHFSIQLRSFIRPRCLPILFDSDVNSEKVQVINFYQVSMLAACKTIGYFATSSMTPHLLNNVTFLLTTIDESLSYAFNLVKDRLKDDSAETHLTRTMAFWLGWQAFVDAFQNSNTHSDLCCHFRKRKNKCENLKRSLAPLATIALHEVDVERLLATHKAKLTVQPTSDSDSGI